jgi:acyl-CoA synthetase (AMP-forming)/AMP-acid ligase II
MWGTMMSYQLTLNGMLERIRRIFSDVEIVSRRPDGSLHRYVYGAFYRRARALAEVLHHEGLKRGERVATLMWNHHAHLEALFGIPAAGGVAHTLNHRLHANDLSYIMNHAQDRFLIVDDVLLPHWEEIKDRVDCKKVIVFSQGSANTPAGYDDYERFIARATGYFNYPSMHENEAAVICYTTGTAGSPKGVVYSHRALVLHSFAMSLPDALAISQRDVVMPVVPIYHANAWGLPFAATMAGCKQVFTGADCAVTDMLQLAQDEGVTLTAGVPSIWLDAMHAMEKDPGRWKLAPGVRVMISGAAPPEAMIRELDGFGIRVVQAWGLVETTPLLTVTTLKPSLEEEPEDKRYEIRATQGLPLPFVELRAIGDSGPIPWDGTTLGEAQVRGPWVTASYYNLPELRGKWTDDGWFRAGDVVKIDPNGYVKITDRAKDLIRYGDDWISSSDLENELMGHPAIREAAVIAVPHPKWQERPLAAVVLKDGEQASAADLRKFLKGKFADWQIPDAFVFLPGLPHTPTGKLLKKELRKQFKTWNWENE